MKKMIAILLTVLILSGRTAFASGEENVSRKTLESFEKEFPGAKSACWQEVGKDDIYLVRFFYQDQGFIAYFNEMGELIATGRLADSGSLPYKVRQAIDKKYGEGEILKVEEVVMDGTISYFFTIEKDNKNILLRIYPDGTMQKISSGKNNLVFKK